MRYAWSAVAMLVLGTTTVAVATPATRSRSISIALATSSVVGGNRVGATITLGAPAPAGGQSVTLTSSSLSIAGIAITGGATAIHTVSVPAGQTSLQVQLQTFGVASPADVVINVSSSAGGAAATLTVTPASVATISFSPSFVVGGNSVTGTVTLNGQAPSASGATVPLSVAPVLLQGQTPPASPAAAVPASVVFRANASRATFTVTTTPTAASQAFAVTATLGQSASATFSVAPPAVRSMRIDPSSVFGGNSAPAVVLLNGIAPGGGTVLTLSSSNTAAVVPSSITVPAGSDRVGFNVRTRTVPGFTTAAITARHPNPTDATANTLLQPSASANLAIFVAPRVGTVAATPSPVTGGLPITVTLTLAPPGDGSVRPISSVSPPIVAQLTADRPDLVQLPANVAFPTGAEQVTVNGATSGASTEQSVVITGSVERSSASTSIVVRPPLPAIGSLSLRPSTITGGLNALASIVFATTAPSPTVVTLSSNRSDLVSLPATVTGNAGTIQTFTVVTSPVTAQTAVTITATAGAQVVTTTLTLVP